MADTANAPTAAIGYTQAPHYNWWLYENETTPELQWPQSIYVYDQMRRTDAQVASVLRAVTLPVRRTPWRIDPNGARPEVVQFVADDLGLPVAGEHDVRPPLRSKNRFSWPEHLRLALTMLPFGHSYFEQLYRVNADGTEAHLAKLEFRPQTTIERIDVATDGGLIAIKQYWTARDRVPQPIPVDRLVGYVHEREGGNWLGTSILRNCYKNWLLKDRLLRVQAQTIERNGMGIPDYEAAETETSLAAGLALTTTLKAGEASGVSRPNGSKLRLMGVEGTLPDADKPIRYHDEQIARAVLAHFLNLGTETGSWALGSTFADFFTLSLQTLAQMIASTATQHIIEDLVDVNWGPDEPAPKLCFDEIGSRQQATAESLKALVDAGIIHPDEPLEGATRQFYGLPPADPATATLPPGQTVGETPAPPTQTGDYSVAASAGDVPDFGDEASWIAAAAGVDTHPGGEQLKHYWLYGKGAALWATWTELYDHLRKYITKEKLLKATVSKWYFLRYGHTPPHHNAVHASVLTGSDEALRAYAEEFAEADAEADDWELQIDALCAALDELSGRVTAAFNPRQPRIPAGQPGGGRFLSMVEHLKGVLYDHVTHGGTGDPFHGFDREQLRRVAVKRGISLKRGESRDSIAEKLLEHLGGTQEGSASSLGVGSGDVPPPAGKHPATPDGVEAAVRELGGSSHDFASLTDLRKRLGGSREEQDRLLVQMARDRRIYLQPEENQKTLTPEDRAAAVDLVGEPKHLVRLGKNAQAPSVEHQPAPNARAAKLAERQSKAGQAAAGVGRTHRAEVAADRRRKREIDVQLSMVQADIDRNERLAVPDPARRQRLRDEQQTLQQEYGEINHRLKQADKRKS